MAYSFVKANSIEMIVSFIELRTLTEVVHLLFSLPVVSDLPSGSK